MHTVKKCKKGFTLVEMMLAIAIILLIGGLFASLVFSIAGAFRRTVNNNDSTDYAVLFGRALENRMIADYQNESNYQYAHGGRTNKITYSIGNDANGRTSLLRNGTAIFNLAQIGSYHDPAVEKWQFFTTYDTSDFDSNGCLHATFYFVDNYSNTNPGDLILRYSTDIWIPYHDIDIQNKGVNMRVPSVSTVSTGIAIPGTSNGFGGNVMSQNLIFTITAP